MIFDEAKAREIDANLARDIVRIMLAQMNRYEARDLLVDLLCLPLGHTGHRIVISLIAVLDQRTYLLPDERP